MVNSVLRFCAAAAISFCLAGSVSRANWSRSFSISASHGQPNIALSQPALTKPAITGLRMSAETHEVRKAFQPPALGGSFLARRATTRLPVHRLHVDLEAGLLHQRFRDRRQVGEHLQVGRVHQHDRRAVVAGFLQQIARLLEVRFRASPLHARRRSPARCRRRTSPCRSCSSSRSPITASQEVLLIEGVPQRLADLRIVERLDAGGWGGRCTGCRAGSSRPA